MTDSHQPVDYDQISQVYDTVRRADHDLIQTFCASLPDEPLTVLDVGCGTGNYLHAFQRTVNGTFYGVEPSAGMREQALAKNPNLQIVDGHASATPFDPQQFDFIYMVDVIHHVPDIKVMFTELARILKPSGKLCIVTQSHQQIASRPIAHFFPQTITVDQARYPDIDEIIATATTFTCLLTTPFQEQMPTILDRHFLELVRKKGYSMLHLIPDEAYETGLQQLEQVLTEGNIQATQAGYTLVWLQKR